MGAAVSRVRSRGDAYTAVGAFARPAMRSAAAAACACPFSARCRPAACPGRILPVVGVTPWRTRRTTVAGGALRPRRAGGRAEAERAVGDTDAHRRLCAVASDRGPKDTVAARATGRGGLPALPAAGALARGGGPHGPGLVRRPGVLGSRRPRLRRSPRRTGARRPGARRPRRQPHRPHVHGRPLGRLALRRALPGRLRVPADEHVTRRRPRADRRLHHRHGALRPARPTSPRRTSGRPAGRTSTASCRSCATPSSWWPSDSSPGRP